MTERLGMALSKVLFEYEPQLLACDLDASARAAAEVATLLGCIMATVLTKNPTGYEAAVRAVIVRVHESAQQTANIAVNAVPNTTPH